MTMLKKIGYCVSFSLVRKNARKLSSWNTSLNQTSNALNYCFCFKKTNCENIEQKAEMFYFEQFENYYNIPIFNVK